MTTEHSAPAGPERRRDTVADVASRALRAHASSPRRPPRRLGAPRRRRRAVDRRAGARLVGAHRRGGRAHGRPSRSAPLFLIGRTAYDVGLDLTRTHVVVGERAVGALTLANTGRRAILPSRVILPVGAGRGVFAVPRLPAGARPKSSSPSRRSGAASCRSGPVSVVRGDPLGLFERVHRRNEPVDLFVHPQTVLFEGQSLGLPPRSRGPARPDLSPDDVSFHALREYQPGDDLRHVHWKSTARTGDVMVRQFEETRRSHFVIGLSRIPATTATQTSSSSRSRPPARSASGPCATRSASTCACRPRPSRRRRASFSSTRCRPRALAPRDGGLVELAGALAATVPARERRGARLRQHRRLGAAPPRVLAPAVRRASARGRRRDGRDPVAAPHRRRGRRHGGRARPAARCAPEGARMTRPDASPRAGGPSTSAPSRCPARRADRRLRPDLRRAWLPRRGRRRRCARPRDRGARRGRRWGILLSRRYRRRLLPLRRCARAAAHHHRRRHPDARHARQLAFGRRHLVEAAPHHGRAGRGIRWPPRRPVPALPRRGGRHRQHRAARPHPAWALLPGRGVPRPPDRARACPSRPPRSCRASSSRPSPCWLAIRQAWAPRRAPSRSARRPARRGMVPRRVLAGAAVVAVAAGVGVATSAFAAPDCTALRAARRRHPAVRHARVRESAAVVPRLVRDDADEALFTRLGSARGRARATGDDGCLRRHGLQRLGRRRGLLERFTPVRAKCRRTPRARPSTLHFEIGALRGLAAGCRRRHECDVRRRPRRRAAPIGVLQRGDGDGRRHGAPREGDAYTLTTVLPADRSDESLDDAPSRRCAMPDQRGCPPELADIASKAVAEATTPDRAGAGARDLLSEAGFFSHGLEGEALSRAGTARSASRRCSAPTRCRRRRAVRHAMALLAAQIGIPARVVMGFYPDEDRRPRRLRGDRRHPPRLGRGRVRRRRLGALRPHAARGPDPERPDDQARADPKPQVLQPPPPAQEPVDLPPTVPDDREIEDEEDAAGAVSALILAIGGSLARSARGARGAVHRDRRAQGRAGATARRPSAPPTASAAAGTSSSTAPSTTARPSAPAPRASRTPASWAPRSPSRASRRSRVAPTSRSSARPSRPPRDVDEFWRQVDEIVGGMAGARSWWTALRRG